MTRINTLPVNLLLDQHLMAEYRELPMVLASLRRSLESPTWHPNKIPKTYRLGSGHVMFFYNKRDFLTTRFALLIRELQRRGFNVNPHERQVDFTVYDAVSNISWEPTLPDHHLNATRIIQRVEQRPAWYRYKGKLVMPARYRAALHRRKYLIESR